MAPSPAQAHVLFPGPSGWQVGTVVETGDVSFAAVPTSASDTPETFAAAIVTALKSNGWRGRGVGLALPSSWCLSARVSTDGLPPKNRRQALTFRLEEKLPVSAEEVAADFVEPEGEGGDALGVCAQTQTVAPYVEALEAAGVPVDSISPAALLAAQNQSPTDCDVLLWGAANEVELFAFRDARPVAWHVLPAEERDLAMHVGIETRGRPQPVRLRAIGLAPDALRPVSALPGVQPVGADESRSLHEAAARAAASVLAGQSAPWVELRRGALSAGDGSRHLHRPLVALVASAALLLAAMSAAMLVRAARYEAAAREREELQRQVFQRAFPGRPVPVDVRSRMLSERQALRAQNGEMGDDGIGTTAGLPPAQASAGLASLRDLLAAFPRGLRFRVVELRLDEGKLLIEGQARSHGDADAIATALRKGGEFAVEPPRTEQLTGISKGVAFTITGTVQQAPAAPAGEPARKGSKRGKDERKQKQERDPAAPIARRSAP